MGTAFGSWESVWSIPYVDLPVRTMRTRAREVWISVEKVNDVCGQRES